MDTLTTISLLLNTLKSVLQDEFGVVVNTGCTYDSHAVLLGLRIEPGPAAGTFVVSGDQGYEPYEHWSHDFVLPGSVFEAADDFEVVKAALLAVADNRRELRRLRGAQGEVNEEVRSHEDHDALMTAIEQEYTDNQQYLAYYTGLGVDPTHL